MRHTNHSRRAFLEQLGVTAGVILVGGRVAGSLAAEAGTLHLATNVYPWITFYRREDRDFNQSLDTGLAEIAAAKLDGFEPILSTLEDVDQLAPLVKRHGLEMRSFYMNTSLHEPAEAEQSIGRVVAIAKQAKEQLGARIVVVNPNPIRWGGPENKNDAQLRTQAASLNELGRQLGEAGAVLAYHYHDIELRNAAREFHHMMVGTDPSHVSLCFDAHWTYRGSGDSAVAVFDVLKLYGPRISELHLRQSRGGVWTEAFGEGDIDYPQLAAYLLSIDARPHLVLEQAVEAQSPKTMDAAAAHREGGRYARRIFARWAG